MDDEGGEEMVELRYKMGVVKNGVEEYYLVEGGFKGSEVKDRECEWSRVVGCG